MTARILLIDDEYVFREDVAELLRQEGFACETASNGDGPWYSTGSSSAAAPGVRRGRS